MTEIRWDLRLSFSVVVPIVALVVVKDPDLGCVPRVLPVILGILAHRGTHANQIGENKVHEN